MQKTVTLIAICLLPPKLSGSFDFSSLCSRASGLVPRHAGDQRRHESESFSLCRTERLSGREILLGWDQAPSITCKHVQR